MLRLGRIHASYTLQVARRRLFSGTTYIRQVSDHATPGSSNSHVVPESEREWNPFNKPARDQPSQQANAVRKRLSSGREHPIEILRDLLKEDDVRIDALSLPLQTMHQRFVDLDRDERRREIQARPIAVEALHFLLHRKDLWPIFANEAHAAQSALCTYAVVEGHDHFIKDWILAETTDPTGGHRKRHVWRGHLFRNLTEAYLVDGPKQSADQALTFFLDIHRQHQAANDVSQHARRRGPSPALTSMPIFPTAILVSQKLWLRRHPNTSSELYDAFAQVWRIAAKKRSTRFFVDFGTANFALAHPTRPSVQPALEFIEQHFNNSKDHDRFIARSLTVCDERISIQVFFSRLYVALYKGDREAEAQRILDKQNELYGTTVPEGIRIRRLDSKGPDARYFK